MRTINERTIAIRIDEELHKKVKIKLAETGTTLKDYISQLIENDLTGTPTKATITEQDIIANANKFAKILNEYANQ